MNFRWNECHYGQTAFYDVLSSSVRNGWMTDKQILDNPSGTHTGQVLEAVCRTLSEITTLIETGAVNTDEIALAKLLYK